jgi:hypothetical protein
VTTAVRRVVLGVTLAVLAGCSSSPAHQSALSPVRHDVSAETHPSPTPSQVSRTATSRAAPRCKHSALRLRAGRESDGTSFAASADILIVNRGHAACTISGVPMVSILRKPAERLPVTYSVPRKVRIRPLTLRAGRGNRALIHLVWLNWCGRPPGSLNVAVSLPHTHGRLVGSFDGPPAYDFVPSCLSAKRASTLTLFTAYRD